MTVRHRNGAYPIVFTSLEIALSELPVHGRLITDHNLAALLPNLVERFPNSQVVTAGETSKSIDQFFELVTWLAQVGTKRSDPLIAFGGGVIGDLAGFVASAYMRGVPLIQVPTTLLAMVDSSVGGKVGVDLPEGKNLVGAFKPPTAVYICPELLATLPDYEFKSGVAEVLKYGFIMDPAMVKDLKAKPLTPNDDRLEPIIRSCVQHKAHVVERDEYETTGLRAILNFGHTVGHAIEQMQGYSDWSHGEAISAGMVVEARLSEVLELCPAGTYETVKNVIQSHGLPTAVPRNLNHDELVETMRLDKKVSTKGLAFSLLTDIGTCKLVTSVNAETVRRVLDELDDD